MRLKLHLAQGDMIYRWQSELQPFLGLYSLCFNTAQTPCFVFLSSCAFPCLHGDFSAFVYHSSFGKTPLCMHVLHYLFCVSICGKYVCIHLCVGVCILVHIPCGGQRSMLGILCHFVFWGSSLLWLDWLASWESACLWHSYHCGDDLITQPSLYFTWLWGFLNAVPQASIVSYIFLEIRCFQTWYRAEHDLELWSRCFLRAEL